jgi:hypothetical protein
MLTFPMLLASAARAEVILIHNHCGHLHFHFLSDPRSHDWHYEHEHDHETAPCHCKRPGSDTSNRAGGDEAPHGLIIHVHELPRPGSASPTLMPENPDGHELVAVPSRVAQASAATAQGRNTPSRARDGTGPPDCGRARSILLTNHALLL